MQKKILTPLILSVLMSPALSVADQNLSLDEAIRLALMQNPDLRAADRQTQVAEARAKAARGQFLPQVDLRYLVRRSDNPLDAFADKLNTRTVDPMSDFTASALNHPDTSTVHATQLSVELPLYTGGRRYAGMREAGAYAKAAKLRHEHQQQLTVYNTLRAYRRAQAATHALVIAEDAVEAAREHAETTARLARQGRIVASDRLTAELNLASVQSLRVQAASRQRLALQDLQLIMGRFSNSDLQLPAWQAPAAPASAPDAALSAQRALAARLDLKASEAMVQASQSKIRGARAAFQPQIGIIAADTWYDDNAALDNKSQSIMGVVSMNLFNGGRDWHGLTAAQRDSEQTELQLEGLQQSVRGEVQAATSRLIEAAARRQIAAQSVDKARENVRLVKQRYGEGRTILIDLLMAERVLVEARNEDLTASLNQELSTAELQLAEGSLPWPGKTPAN